MIQIEESFREATILGFIDKIETEQFPLNQLQPIDQLFDYLDPCDRVVESSKKESGCVDLGQWLQGIFDETWQDIASLLSARKMQIAFRFRDAESTVSSDENSLPSSAKKAKSLTISTPFGDCELALVLEITPESEETFEVFIQLYAIGQSVFLPPRLTLQIIDESEQVFGEVIARERDNILQYRLIHLVPSESFRIKISYEDVSVREDFRI